MADEGKIKQPDRSAAGLARARRDFERKALALRENLRRRKAQAHARDRAPDSDQEDT